jgi:hypothetical protein
VRELVLLGKNRELGGEGSSVLGGMLYHPWRLRVCSEIAIRRRLIGKNEDAVPAEAFEGA